MAAAGAIRRLTVELHAADAAAAARAQEQVRGLAALTTEVERACLAISGPDRHDRIERVEVDLGVMAPGELPAVMVARLRDRLPAALATALGLSRARRAPPPSPSPAGTTRAPHPPGEGPPRPRRSVAAHVELLALATRTGMLPWWADPAEPDAVASSSRAILAAAPGKAGALLRALAADDRAVQRLALALDDATAAGLAEAAAPGAGELLAPVARSPALAALPRHRRHVIARRAVLTAAGATRPGATPDELRHAVAGAAARAARRPAAEVLAALPPAGAAHRQAARALAEAIRRAATEGMLTPLVAGRLAELAAAARAEPAPGPVDAAGHAAAVIPLLARLPAAERAMWEERLAAAGSVLAAAATAAAALDRLLQPEPLPPTQPVPDAEPQEAAPPVAATPPGAAEVGAPGDALPPLARVMPDGAERGAPPQAVGRDPGGAESAEPGIARRRVAELPPGAAEGDAPRVAVTQEAASVVPAAPPGAAPPKLAAPTGVGETGATTEPAVTPAGPGSALPPGPAQPLAGVDVAFGDTDTAYVPNGGLVLLAPFLPRCFERLGLAERGGFLDPAARHRATGLLHFAAAGERAPLEYQVTLAKVLCGLAVDEPFDFGPPATDAEAEEVDDMLAAVIAHAAVLGDISVPGLRGTFLLRRAALTAEGGSWVLRVERETFDVLLDRLPWSFGWVALPWMSTPVRVEW